MAKLWSQREAAETYTFHDLMDIHEMMDVREENERRARKASNG